MIIQSGVNGVNGNVIFNGFQYGALHIVATGKLLNPKNDGVEANNQVAIPGNSFVHGFFQRI